MGDGRAALVEGHGWLRNWALTRAAPLWAERGIDRRHGGFVERLDHDGNEILVPRRARLVARQIYSFSVLQRLGWRAADDPVGHGLDTLMSFIGDDGEVVPERTPDGAIARRGHDLYDVAFVLFALATLAADGRSSVHVASVALAVRARLTGHRHAGGGFAASASGALPLEANPHMHLLEAALAWAAVRGADAGWSALADDIASLCLSHFIDPSTGRLREFYDAGWRPFPGDAGRLIEPGHQFEWAWLLVRWGRARHRTDAVSAAERLAHGAERDGVDERGIAFNALNDDGSVRDRDARLWPQTERIKAWIALAGIAVAPDARDSADARVAAAIRGLARFLDTRVPGLWYETIDADGRPREEAVRASSLYHILCALDEVDRYVGASGQID